MIILQSTLAFLFALGIIVFIHELGHFLTAKMFGVRVLTFSLGFGRRLWGFDYRGTDCRISAIPLGGYVSMGGELPDERTSDPSEFLNKPRWQRIVVYLAGPAMNVVLSVLVIAGVFMSGIEYQAMQEIPAVVGFVQEGSPAEAAGMQVGDRILRVGGEEVARWKDVSFVVATSPERELELEVEREGQTLTTSMVPTKEPRDGYGESGMEPEVRVLISDVVKGSRAEAAGFRSGDQPVAVGGDVVETWADFVAGIEASPEQEVQVTVRREEQLVRLDVLPEAIEGKGRIGVWGGFYRRLPLGEALVESIKFNAEIVQKSAQIIGKIFTREVAAQSVLSGPIEIANISGQAARRGFKDLLFTIGFLSISIGFMNLLPIPVLDGGHIFILLIESVMRRDLSVVVKERIAKVGFMMLMTLMALVIVFDLLKNLPPLVPGS